MVFTAQFHEFHSLPISTVDKSLQFPELYLNSLYTSRPNTCYSLIS